MTHFFIVSENEMQLLNSEKKKFDILKFNRSVKIGDTIIYQLEETEFIESEDESKATNPDLPQEYTVCIGFLFDDSEGALKKGYTAIGF